MKAGAMTHRASPDAVPKPALIGAAALVLCALAAAFVARTSGIGTTQTTPAAPVRVIDLRFTDRADGAVDVRRVLPGGSDRPIGLIASGDGGFQRGVLRSLTRERRLNGTGQQAPFRLSLHLDGGLILEDLATGRLIDLRAFGPTNTQAFAQFLREDPIDSPRSAPVPLAAVSDQ